jgi:hypothetical protein
LLSIITVESVSRFFVPFGGLLNVWSCLFYNASGVFASLSDLEKFNDYSTRLGFWPDFGDLIGVGENVELRACICFSCQALKFESSFFISKLN